MSSSSQESPPFSCLDYDDTVLSLAPPGASSSASGSASSAPESDRKRLSSSSSSSDKTPATKARAVGWPPVRSYRRNALQAKSCKLVKVAVDGAPYLRKVDLEAFDAYAPLLNSLQEMFSCFAIRAGDDGEEERKLVHSVSGAEYVPTYEDKEGDWMLVGDVPWKMFVESCKRIRLMKSSEAVNLAPRASH